MCPWAPGLSGDGVHRCGLRSAASLNVPFAVWAAEPTHLPFLLQSCSIASSLSAGSSKRYFRGFLAQLSPRALSHPARQVSSIAIGFRDLSYLSLLFDICRGLLCAGGFLRAPFRSSCSEITESTWTAVAQRGVGKCIHKALVFCRRERGAAGAAGAWRWPSCGARSAGELCLPHLKRGEKNPSPTSKLWLVGRIGGFLEL